MRRSWVWMLVIVVIGCACLVEAACAQDLDRKSIGPRSAAVSEREVLRGLDEARRVIAAKQFHPAVQLLQSVLDQDEDFFVEQSLRRDGDDFRDDRDGAGGVKAVALKLLKNLPAEGRAAYELDYGVAARNQLSLAIDDSDFDLIAQVARRFSLTAAGFEATVLLAARASDCNRPLEAALLLDTLQGHPVAAQKRTPLFLLNVAGCWSRAGRADRSLETLRELKRHAAGDSLRVGGRDVTLFARDDEAATWLAALVGSSSRSSSLLVASWAMPGGSPTRNESAAPASPVGGDRWRVSLFEHLAMFNRIEAGVGTLVKPLLEGSLPPRATLRLGNAARPEPSRPSTDHADPNVSAKVIQLRRAQLEGLVAREQLALRDDVRIALPAAMPLIIGDTIVYRTIADVTAVQLRTGELLWRSSLTDSALTRLWNNRTIETRGGEVRDVNEAINVSLSAHVRRRLFRDAAAGLLSSDGQTVFALEELDSSNSNANALRGMAEPAASNKLVAYDVAGGRMLWEAGGPRGAKPHELSGHFFLGPPLPLDGRLYCLAEMQGDLRLLVLEQTANREGVQIDWAQTLIAVDQPVASSPLRRLSGLSPSFADGILVCPTSTGAVIAIDIVRRVLLWGHPYTSIAANDQPEFGGAMFGRVRQSLPPLVDIDEKSRWLDGSPLMAEGRVIVTPRDADVLLCLDVLDGRLLWTLPRGDWLYPACVLDGQVVLVGRDGLAAFHLVDGKPVETFASIGVEPAGRGVRVGTRYFLPLANGEIATVDLKSGRILARAKLSEGRIPGNLVAGAGAIISQSAGELIGFRPLRDIEAQIADKLQADPHEPVALALRGELRLHRGDEAKGLADLRESLRRQPDPRVKSILAASLLAGLRGDVALVHDRAAELESLTDDPQQRNEFLRIYAKRLDEAGDRRGAFAQWIRLAETSQFLNDLDPLTSHHAVRTDRVVRARLAKMYQAASAEDRAVFDTLLSEHVASRLERATSGKSRKAADLGAHLEQSLRFFAGLPQVEQRLLEQVVTIEGATHAEGLLERFAASSDPTVAAKAASLLARELLQSNRVGEALSWIERLRDEFADQKCFDNQTGRSLAEQWLKRDDVQQQLNVTTVWTAGTIDISRKSRETAEQQTPVPPINMPVEVVSRRGMLFEGWSFETDAGARTLTARDADSRIRWKVAIPADATVSEFNGFTGRSMVSSSQLHLQDRWLALNLDSHFVMFQVVDHGQAPRAVWQQTLRPNGLTRMEMQLAQQGIRVRMLPNGQMVPLGGRASSSQAFGRLVGLTREVAIYIVGEKLCAAELDTGRLAWWRRDVVPGLVVASVDESVVSIRPNQTRDITLLRTLDGADVAKRRPQGSDSVMWDIGSRMLTLSQREERAITMQDLVRDEDLWTRPLSAKNLMTVIDDQDVAFLEVHEEQSRWVVVGLADGRERYRADLPFPLHAIHRGQLFVQRQPDRDIVFVTDTSPSRDGGPVQGYVSSIQRADGRRLWTTPVKDVGFDRLQPTRLPVLLLSNQVNGAAADPFSNMSRLSATLLDKRTGRLLYETRENSRNMPPRLEPDPDQRRLVANFHGWQLDLTFPEPTPAEPTKTGPVPKADQPSAK